MNCPKCGAKLERCPCCGELIHVQECIPIYPPPIYPYPPIYPPPVIPNPLYPPWIITCGDPFPSVSVSNEVNS